MFQVSCLSLADHWILQVLRAQFLIGINYLILRLTFLESWFDMTGKNTWNQIDCQQMLKFTNSLLVFLVKTWTSHSCYHSLKSFLKHLISVSFAKGGAEGNCRSSPLQWCCAFLQTGPSGRVRHRSDVAQPVYIVQHWWRVAAERGAEVVCIWAYFH